MTSRFNHNGPFSLLCFDADCYKSVCQHLEVPADGINVHDQFTMKCHFGETGGVIGFTNWYHSNINELNQLYTHIPNQSGEKKNEWAQRDVTAVYHDTYHEVSVKHAVQEDEKLYICQFFVTMDGLIDAEALLHVHGNVD